MVRGRMPLIATGVLLASLGLATAAHAAFPPLRVVPPTGTGGITEVEPPPTVTPPCDPPAHQSPEPGTMVLAAIGAGTLAAWKRRRSSKQG